MHPLIKTAAIGRKRFLAIKQQGHGRDTYNGYDLQHGILLAKVLKSDDLIRVSDESAAMPKSMPKIVEGEAGELQVGGGHPEVGLSPCLLS